MNVSIPYGNTSLPADLPDSTSFLVIREPEAVMNPERFSQILDDALHERQPDLSAPVVIVADKTRVCGYGTYLPILTETLIKFGTLAERLCFIIAYGTHPRQSDEESYQCYGETYNKFTFIHHDCTQGECFKDLGTTSKGTPIRIRQDILDASCVITIGPICHHYFAGYGGGRKLIFPGCGEREAIYANHGLYLDRNTAELSIGCQPGVLADNPLADDLFEIADYKESDLSIHGIMNSHGDVCDFLIGSTRETYLEACRYHGSLCESASHQFPVVVASCGGFPKDINFIQSHKAIHNSAMFVEDGGLLLIFSECRDDIGSTTFLPWFELGDFSRAFAKLTENYQGNGGTALAMMTKTRRIRIAMVTELTEDICKKIGVEKWDKSKALDFLSNLQEESAYIANASLLVRKSI